MQKLTIIVYYVYDTLYGVFLQYNSYIYVHSRARGIHRYQTHHDQLCMAILKNYRAWSGEERTELARIGYDTIELNATNLG